MRSDASSLSLNCAACSTAYPQAIANTARIAEACPFSLDELRYEYPDEIANGQMPNDRLRELTEAGLKRRYPDAVPLKVRGMVEKELRLISELDYARYFLTVHDVVAFARSKGILCQGRGSAANSVVCYALGITEASPDMITMVFERFISEARNEPPDIDVDFEHERREEVIQHIYEKYGRPPRRPVLDGRPLPFAWHAPDRNSSPSRRACGFRVTSGNAALAPRASASANPSRMALRFAGSR